MAETKDIAFADPGAAGSTSGSVAPMAAMTDADVSFVGSGSLRKDRFGPLVTLGELRALYPYDEPISKCRVTGKVLRRAFSGIMRPENRTGEGECYQVSRGVRAVYDNASHELVELTLNGEPIDDAREYRITLQNFHLQNCGKGFQLAAEDLSHSRTVATSGRDLLEEWLRTNQNIDRSVEGRLVYLGEAPSRPS